MCYAIPGKIKSIEGKTVFVDYFGEEKKAYNEIDDLRVGDYIYAQGGFVIEKIDSLSAESILSVWKESFFELQEVDLKLSRLHVQNIGLDRRYAIILDRAMEGIPPDREEMLYLMNFNDKEHLDLFLKTANFIRQKYLKNSCCVHGVLEISNQCASACTYCGISTHNRSLRRYRMKRDQIITAAHEAIEKFGFKALVLQSGEDPGYSIDEFADMIHEIKKKSPALIFISFGEIGEPGLRQLYDAGARGLLMRFETSNSDLYQKLHSGELLADRLHHIRMAREMGYVIITGGLVGLPGQTTEDIVNDLFLTRELGADMFSFGPFLPHPYTPLADFHPLKESDMLKVIAAARLIDPKEARILITTAFETLSPDARKKGLSAGGNSVMLNVTPVHFRELYAIYPNRAYRSELVQHQINETIALLGALGRAPTDLGIK